MKTTSTSLSLMLAAALAATAQDAPPVPVPPVQPVPPAPPVEPAKPAEAPAPRVSGGKVLLKSGKGKEARTEILDFQGDQNADSPLSLRFKHHNIFRKSAGPVTFMGVAVSSAPQELATHLPLDQGVGLVVETVSKDSPAEKAGIQKNDILTKLDDQLLIHPAQFSVLVGRRKDGDSVKLTLLRKGAVQEIPVTLGKSDDGDAAGGPGTLQIGDVNIEIDNADAAPLKTIVKELRLDGPAGGGAGGTVVEINGDKIQTAGDVKWQDFHEKVKDSAQKAQDKAQAVRAEALKALEKAKAAAEAAGTGLKEKAREEAIRQLEDALRRLKEE